MALPTHVQDLLDANHGAPWVNKYYRLVTRVEEVVFTAHGASERVASARLDQMAAVSARTNRLQQAAAYSVAPTAAQTAGDEAAIERAKANYVEATKAAKAASTKAGNARELLGRVESYLEQLSRGAA